MIRSPSSRTAGAGRAAAPGRPEPSSPGPRSVALRCAAPGSKKEADAFVVFLMRRLRETVNQARPRSQLLRLCAGPAQADVATLIRSLDARQLIVEAAASSFALEGRGDVHDFVCRFDCAHGPMRVLFGRIRRGSEGWRLLSLHQLPVAPGARPRWPQTAGGRVPTTV
ncbi:MAG: hypothetical protein ACRC20_11785 [Segniliparus sp.]|uniref:hypothetical protein n=1 Tax=Segniliparus sp. TaxID=2804064 RepID=UPI003F2B9FA1